MFRQTFFLLSFISRKLIPAQLHYYLSTINCKILTTILTTYMNSKGVLCTELQHQPTTTSNSVAKWLYSRTLLINLVTNRLQKSGHINRIEILKEFSNKENDCVFVQGRFKWL